MEIHPLRAEEPAVRRFVEELWLPYHRELERTVETHALEEEADLVEEELAFRLEWLEDDDHRIRIAEAEVAAEAGDAGTDREPRFAGFVASALHSAPSVFDQPDRLLIGDLYAREDHRGTGLTRRLVERAAEEARERGCSELELDVDVDNERAIAFYEKLGFEPHRRTLTTPVEEL